MPSTSIYVVTNGKLSFLWMDNILFCVFVCVCVPHLLYPFIYLWNIACFHVFVIINNAVMNIGVHISFHVSVFCFLWLNTQKWNCWKPELFFFFFEGPPYCFSIVTAPVYDSINNSQEPPFPISLPPVHTAWCQSFWQAWGSNSLWFVFAFPWWLVMLIIFSCVCWNSMCILWKNVHWGSQTTFQFDCFPDFELYQFFIYFAY